jgi:hypothetical protein
MTKLALLAALMMMGAGCSVTHRVEVFPHGVPKQWVCGDGLPVRVIQDVRCTDGVCGFTCEPDRWVRAPVVKQGGQ